MWRSYIGTPRWSTYGCDNPIQQKCALAGTWHQLLVPEFANSGSSVVTPASKPRKHSTKKRKVDIFKPTQDLWGKRIKQSVLWKTEHELNKVQVPLFPVFQPEKSTINANDTSGEEADEYMDASITLLDDDNSKLPATQASDEDTNWMPILIH